MAETLTPHEMAVQAAEAIRQQSGVDGVDILLTLGSGWAHGADQLGDVQARMPIEELPGFSKPVVAGHGGQALITRLPTGKTGLILTGRTHLYEGRGAAAVVHGVRTAAELGAKTVVLTNGCGGLDPTWPPGTIALIKDHINLTGDTPLVGAVFIDMSDAYSTELRKIAHDVDPGLPEGVYAQFRGPSYETPAEVRMAGAMGATLVGMSTALETIAAVEAGMDVLGLSLVTNHAAGVTGEVLAHADVLAAGNQAGPRLASLLEKLCARL